MTLTLAPALLRAALAAADRGWPVFPSVPATSGPPDIPNATALALTAAQTATEPRNSAPRS